MVISPIPASFFPALCLIAALPLSAASPITLQPPLVDLRIDGELAEWSLAAGFSPLAVSFVQVAGKSRVEGEHDFSAEVFIALSSAGLAMAGQVRDDHVLFPEAEPDRLGSDHVGRGGSPLRQQVCGAVRASRSPC